MLRGLTCLLWLPLLGAQVPQQDAFDLETQAYYFARGRLDFEAAAKHRDKARLLLAALPAEDQQSAYRARMVAQLYDSAGLIARGRGVLEQVLARSPAGSPARASILSAISDSWEQDRNLLKAIAYREQAVAAFEQQSSAEPAAGASRQAVFGCFRSAVPNAMNDVQRLAYLYRQAGRREDVARLIEKVRAQPQSQDVLAALYEQDGQLEEAAAIYRSQAEHAAGDPQHASTALQSMSRIQQNQQKPSEAAATLTQAVNLLASSDRPEVRSQTLWVRQNLAMVLNQAGQTEAADRVFDQLLAEADEGTRSQLLSAYANHLASTQRGPQAEAMLKSQLESPNLQPWEEANLYFALANTARNSGDEARAQAYQQTAEEKQRAGQPEQASQLLIHDDLQKADAAARAGNVEGAVQLATSAIGKATGAADWEQLPWGVSTIAATVGTKDPAAGDDLYRRLFAHLENGSSDLVQPLLNIYPQYARFLMEHQRWGEAATAVNSYRSALTASRGEGTGWLGDVMQLQLEAARIENKPAEALATSRAWLEFEEQVAGTTSESYLRALESMAETLDASGDLGSSLAARRQAVAIVDLVSGPLDLRRGYTRMNAAFAFARAQQFDEAEQLGRGAVAIGASLRPPQPNPFEPQLQQILQMKTAASTQAAALE